MSYTKEQIEQCAKDLRDESERGENSLFGSGDEAAAMLRQLLAESEAKAASIAELEALVEARRAAPAGWKPVDAELVWRSFVELVRIDANAKEVKNIIGGEEKLRSLFFQAAAPDFKEGA